MTNKIKLLFTVLIITSSSLNLYAAGPNQTRGGGSNNQTISGEHASGKPTTANCDPSVADSSCAAQTLGAQPTGGGAFETKIEYITTPCPAPNETFNSIIKRVTNRNLATGAVISTTDTSIQDCPGSALLSVKLTEVDGKGNYNVRVFSNTSNVNSIDCGGGSLGPPATTCNKVYSGAGAGTTARIEFLPGKILPEQNYGYSFAVTGATCNSGRFENSAANGPQWKDGVQSVCSGDGVSCNGFICDIPMTKPRTFTLTFSKNTPSNNVKLDAAVENCAITGSGLNCPGKCSANQTLNSVATITATPAAGYTFAGWSGDAAACGTSASCSLSMTADRIAGATCTATPPGADHNLNVSINGDGAVTGSGISCPGDCFEAFSSGTNVTLSAAPLNGASFSGWSGCSSVSGATCYVTMGSDKWVNASFAAAPAFYTLTVNKIGSGQGAVTGSGISCGGGCTQTYPAGTTVGLSATPSGVDIFDGWSGSGCGGVGGCNINMDGNKTVNAQFTAGVTCSPGYTGNPCSKVVVPMGDSYPGCNSQVTYSVTSGWNGSSMRVQISWDTLSGGAAKSHITYRQYSWDSAGKTWIYSNYAPTWHSSASPCAGCACNALDLNSDGVILNSLYP